MDEKFVGAPASWCAAIAHYMSRHMLRKGNWTARHIYFSNYTEDQLESGVKAVREALCDPATHHKAVFDKYAERKFRKASLFVQNWVTMVQRNTALDFNFTN
ncbi:hypothetical protein FF38_04554 [Lucilia cuprina]|uniref:Cyclin C-terminal domain-containing protein n=1 Tax=Lucilia cuprina TaxID=7375 RepID=A0A0L0BQ96_LUCCU|nr:hypothetical protein FF38_04554 [Lucilia cuprina]